MEVGKDFSNWIKDRIDRFGYENGRDYVESFGSPILANQNGRGGDRRSIEYHLSLDMAKELSMLERNPMGRIARKWFINCEKSAKEMQKSMAIIPVLQQELLQSNQRMNNILRYHRIGLTRAEIRKLTGLGKDSVRLCFRRLERCGLVDKPKDLEAMRQKIEVMRQKQLPLFAEAHS